MKMIVHYYMNFVRRIDVKKLKTWFNEKVKTWFCVNKISKTRYIVSAVIAALLALLSVFIYSFGYIHVIISFLAWTGVFFAALICPLEVKNEMPYSARAVFMLLLTMLEFMLMQNTISCGTISLSPLLFLINCLILLGVKSLVWAASGSMKAGAIVSLAVSYVIAVADYIVVQARGFEIQFSDLSSVGTAMDVAGGYLKMDFFPAMRFSVVTGLIYLCLLIVTKFPKREFSKKQLVFSASPILLSVLCVCMVFNQSMSKPLGITDKYWQYRGSELNGFFVNIVYSASATRICEPFEYFLGEGDNVTSLNDILHNEPEEDTTETDPPETEPSVPVISPDVDDEEKKPHVIVVMNETFSDIESVAASLGVELTTETGEEVLPYFHSLTDEAPNIIKGEAIASVYGGNTANSEFEFLTGMSMAFLPRNTVAYNLYLNENNTFGIVESFKEAGYTTIGMHPENRVNWKRDTVYSEYYGFDRTYFIDDFGELTEEDMYRTHVSDKAVYEKIIELYENREEDETLFTFAITMQNHGGYQTKDFNYEVKVNDANKVANEYFTSVSHSDSDLEYLISYFEEADEEVIILFFGDHQPSCTHIREKILGVTEDSTDAERLAQYRVPYFYWSNEDIESDVPKTTSLNFLSGYLMDMCGVEKTVFQEFVTTINSEVMAINALGWLDYDFNFTPLSYGGEIENAYLNWYSSLQYNALFDNNKLVELFSHNAESIQGDGSTAPETDEDGNLVTDNETLPEEPVDYETDEYGNTLGEEPN